MYKVARRHRTCFVEFSAKGIFNLPAVQLSRPPVRRIINPPVRRSFKPPTFFGLAKSVGPPQFLVPAKFRRIFDPPVRRSEVGGPPVRRIFDPPVRRSLGSPVPKFAEPPMSFGPAPVRRIFNPPVRRSVGSPQFFGPAKVIWVYGLFDPPVRQSEVGGPPVRWVNGTDPQVRRSWGIRRA